VRQRRVNLHRLARHALLTLRVEPVQRAHVVQPVRQLIKTTRMSPLRRTSCAGCPPARRRPRRPPGAQQAEVVQLGHVFHQAATSAPKRFDMSSLLRRSSPRRAAPRHRRAVQLQVRNRHRALIADDVRLRFGGSPSRAFSANVRLDRARPLR
jgi:hypothetical protein